MLMTTPSDKPKGSSLPFAFGILFGVAATFLFGTDEGRKIVKKVVDSIPEKYKNLDTSLRGGTPTWQSISNFPTEETQHHAILESPPPPSPSVRPTRPEPFKPTL